MIKIVDRNIYLTRGDSAVLTVNITSSTGVKWLPSTGDKVYISIKRNVTDPEPLRVINHIIDDDDILILITPDITKDLTCGQYIYDIVAETAAGNVYTVIADKIWEVGKEAHTEWS